MFVFIFYLNQQNLYISEQMLECSLWACPARSHFNLTVLIPTSTVRNLTIEKSFSEDSNNPDIDFDGEGDDDQAEFHADNNESTHPAVQSRWPTRVSAVANQK